MTASLHHVVLGSGPPMLLMHGGLGFDHTYLRPWLDPLADDVRLVFYDHFGNGRSPWPDDWSELTHERLVADADHLADHLALDRFHLLGHSYGGFLALEYALRNPDRLLGLVLVSAAPAMEHVPVCLARARERGSALEAETFERGVASPPTSPDEMGRMLETVLPLYFRRYTRDVGGAVLADMQLSPGAFRQAFHHCLPGWDMRGHLAEIDVPTLVLGGRWDWIVPPEHGPEPLARGIRHAELRIFEESGHFPFIEERGPFLEAVRDWLREREDGA